METIKEEKKADLEQLLNSLVEAWWKPRWYEDVYKFKLYKLWYTIARPQKQKMISFATETRHYINWTDYIWYKWYSLRELVSKESWLWQYVCENDLLNIKKEKKRITPEHLRVFNWEYQYRLIESALIDERELESFILNNIKVDEKD